MLRLALLMWAEYPVLPHCWISLLTFAPALRWALVFIILCLYLSRFNCINVRTHALVAPGRMQREVIVVCVPGMVFSTLKHPTKERDMKFY